MDTRGGKAPVRCFVFPRDLNPPLSFVAVSSILSVQKPTVLMKFHVIGIQRFMSLKKKMETVRAGSSCYAVAVIGNQIIFHSDPSLVIQSPSSRIGACPDVPLPTILNVFTA